MKRAWMAIFGVITMLGAPNTLRWPVRAHAASLPGWDRTCYAPNWITGQMEAVPEANVHDPASPLWGVTRPLPGGRWRIQYNTAKIFGPTATRAMLQFLFYHECAHARTGSVDERVADCLGLQMMDDDIGVTAEAVAQIRFNYQSVGRQFPSGPC
jgi:hypothetical protein